MRISTKLQVASRALVRLIAYQTSWTRHSKWEAWVRDRVRTNDQRKENCQTRWTDNLIEINNRAQ